MKHLFILSALAMSPLFAADNNELSRQATDPTASLMALNFKSTYVGGLPSRFALNPQYNLQDDRGLSGWLVTFTYTALFPSF